MLFDSDYQNRYQPISWLFGWICVWSIIWPISASATDVADRRIQISLPIFPRIVAVDNDFSHKLHPKGKVTFSFLYESNKAKAETLAEALKQKLTNVAGLEFTAQAVAVREQLTEQAPVPTAMFITEQFSEKTFVAVLEYSVKQHRILFSPFTGDVERGATAGIAITSRVKPFFNIATLKRAQIDINPVLMKLSKRYE
jgi:hypothetical protein